MWCAKKIYNTSGDQSWGWFVDIGVCGYMGLVLAVHQQQEWAGGAGGVYTCRQLLNRKNSPPSCPNIWSAAHQ